jgi:hypothetical protein
MTGELQNIKPYIKPRANKSQALFLLREYYSYIVAFQILVTLMLLLVVIFIEPGILELLADF